MRLLRGLVVFGVLMCLLGCSRAGADDIKKSSEEVSTTTTAQDTGLPDWAIDSDEAEKYEIAQQGEEVNCYNKYTLQVTDVLCTDNLYDVYKITTGESVDKMITTIMSGFGEGGSVKNNFIFEDGSLNPNQTLFDGFVMLKMKITAKETREQYMMFNLYELQEDGELKDKFGVELLYYDIIQREDNYWPMYKFAAGEETTFTMIFTTHKTEFKNLHFPTEFMYPYRGSSGDNYGEFRKGTVIVPVLLEGQTEWHLE